MINQPTEIVRLDCTQCGTRFFDHVRPGTVLPTHADGHGRPVCRVCWDQVTTQPVRHTLHNPSLLPFAKHEFSVLRSGNRRHVMINGLVIDTLTVDVDEHAQPVDVIFGWINNMITEATR